MSDAVARRLRRYAILSAVQLVVLLVVVAPRLAGDLTGLLVLVAWAPTMFAWGHFQHDVSVNPDLDEPAQRWWRVAFLFPGTMAAYWWRYVR